MFPIREKERECVAIEDSRFRKFFLSKKKKKKKKKNFILGRRNENAMK